MTTDKPVNVLSTLDQGIKFAVVDELPEVRKRVAELMVAAKGYLEARGTTHGQKWRIRLRTAIAAMGEDA